MRIAVGLSGGVDSSVTAALLKKEGHDVFAVTMLLAPSENIETSESIEEAKRVADFLEIPHFPIDCRNMFNSNIISYMQEEYSKARTPNPCIICNKKIKFGLFWEAVEENDLQFDHFATGHYAEIVTIKESGRLSIKTGVHTEKDQSYFLSFLSQEQLKRTMFPLGKFKKDDIRQMATEFNLPTANKKESQDLCIGAYRDYLESTSGPGEIVSTTGVILGKHTGIENYTIGQRRGLGIGAGEPLYVIAINRPDNRVIVGSNKDLFSKTIEISQINWVGIKNPPIPFKGIVKIRYGDEGCPATCSKMLPNGNIIIEFEKPRRAITPGQIATLYNNDTVSFAGVIEKSVDVNL